ncbi:flavin reductase (NADPH) isoform X1 [Eurytemora carolleeae]|uniref:flavin reductase (NADPH) isoform X1 n=1 Tax=Eurytemora carolleeae TaxID=1294199 RepID=UPI000C7841A7|nr:flavin reductase (NADPH) isoform X1 [Eurytemora carolleeae]|eukprot:XP_023332321.1 flavin reductase (NADPH)-like isoform X1 [Eurytemora affinis]
MRIAVFGATGGTGLQLLEQALAANHHVTAIVRTPAKIKMTHENLKVVTGDVFNTESIEGALADQDTVFSCLGFKPEKPAVTGYINATKSIVAAMKKNGLKRLVLCHSWYTDPESRGEAIFLIRWFLLPMIRTVLDNMRETELWLETECADIDYTVVRPGGLTNGQLTDTEIKHIEGPHVKGSSRITRADVARFMLNTASTQEFIKKQVAIGY